MKHRVPAAGVPDAFFTAGRTMDDLGKLQLADFYGRVIEVEDESGDPGVVIYVPASELADILADDEEND